MDKGFEIQRRLSKVIQYNSWIYDSFKEHVGRRILDVGCGYGNITQFLLDQRDLVIGLDRSPLMYEEISKRLSGRSNFVPILGDTNDVELLRSLKTYRIETVVCLNVLEHIENDIGALNHYHDVLIDDGKLILLVPAHQFLFGSMDRADGHFRRYTRREVSRKVGLCGFEVLTWKYMNFLGILGWFLNGQIFRRDVIPESQYAAYDRLVPLLREIETRVRVPIGLSLLFICRKISGLARRSEQHVPKLKRFHSKCFICSGELGLTVRVKLP